MNVVYILKYNQFILKIFMWRGVIFFNKVYNMFLINSSVSLKDQKICWIVRRYVGWFVNVFICRKKK